MTPTRDELIDLREKQGMTRERIAEHYDVSLATVRRWIRDLKVPRPSKQVQYKQPTHLSREGAIIDDPDDGETVMEHAQRILGGRLTERRGYGYMLDGRPASSQAVVHAAGLKMKDEQ